MATQLSNVLQAVDEYMANNGGGKKYLMKKFQNFFEKKDSIFNMTDGPLVQLGDETKKLTKTLKVVDTTMTTLVNKVRTYRDAMKFGHFKQLETVSHSLQKKLKNFGNSLGLQGMVPNQPTANSRILNRTLYNIEKNTLLTYFGITNLHKTLAESRRESVLNNRGANSALVSNIVNNIMDRRERNREPIYTDNSSKGSLLGKIFKTLFLGAGALFAPGIIKNFLNNNQYGTLIRDSISSTFGFISDSISTFIKSGTFNKMMEDSFSAIKDVINITHDGIKKFLVDNKDDIIKSISGMGKSFYEQIITPAIDATKKDIENGDVDGLLTKGALAGGGYALLSRMPIFKQLHKFVIMPAIRGIPAIIQSLGTVSSGLLRGTPALLRSLSSAASIGRFLWAVAPLPLKVAVGTAIAAYTAWKPHIDKINKINEEVKTRTLENTALMKGVNTEERTKYLDRIAQLDKRGENISQKEILEKKLLEAQIRNLNVLDELADIQKTDNLQKSTFWNNLVTPLGLGRKTPTYVTDRIKELNDALAQNTSTIEKIEKDIVTASTKSSKVAQDEWLKTTMKAIKSGSGGVESGLKSSATDNKLDNSFKELSKKVDQLSSVFSAGMIALATATSNGNGAVVSAIISSSKSPVVVPVSTRDPVQEFRTRANTRLAD